MSYCEKIYTWFWKNTTRNLLLSISAFLVKLIYNKITLNVEVLLNVNSETLNFYELFFLVFSTIYNMEDLSHHKSWFNHDILRWTEMAIRLSPGLWLDWSDWLWECPARAWENSGQRRPAENPASSPGRALSTLLRPLYYLLGRNRINLWPQFIITNKETKLDNCIGID